MMLTSLIYDIVECTGRYCSQFGPPKGQAMIVIANAMGTSTGRIGNHVKAVGAPPLGQKAVGGIGVKHIYSTKDTFFIERVPVDEKAIMARWSETTHRSQSRMLAYRWGCSGGRQGAAKGVDKDKE